MRLGDLLFLGPLVLLGALAVYAIVYISVCRVRDRVRERRAQAVVRRARLDVR